MREMTWPRLRQSRATPITNSLPTATPRELFTNSKRMVWSGIDCQPHSKYDGAEGTARAKFHDIVAFSDLGPKHDEARCFYFGRGVWNATLDVGAFQRDVAAVRTGKAKARWTCTMEQLSRQASLRMTFTESDAKTRKRSQSNLGGRPRQVRFGEVHHSECNLVNLKDPYSLLVALGSLQGGGTSYTSIEILGDSLHRGLFATVVAMLRGVGERAFFDRQSHSHLRYIVTAVGDFFTTDHDGPPPDDTLLDVKYHAVFGYNFESFPPRLRLTDRPPTVLIAGGLEHAEFDCNTRHPRVAALLGYTSMLNGHINSVRTNGLRQWQVVQANTSSEANFSPPTDESLILIKAGIQPQAYFSQNGGVFRGYFTMRNHVYREIIDNNAEQILKLEHEGQFPPPAIDYLRASLGVFFLDEVRLHPLADEGPARVKNISHRLIKYTGARPFVVNVSSVLDEEVHPSDGLHSTCTMHWSIPASVGGWHLDYSTCRGWRERGNVQLLASMIVATARQRYAAEQRSLKWRP